MELYIALGILIPFAGTALGAACVFFMRKKMNEEIQKILLGFASGVMVAASVWSLLIPAMEMSAGLGRLAFFPAAAGFVMGMVFLLALDRLVPHMHLDEHPDGPKRPWSRTTMLLFAVTLHNIPEGMAVGVVFAGTCSPGGLVTMAEAFALSAGIAIQNFPEGAIISLPLRANGASRGKAFLMGALSGAVEPAAAVLTMLLAGFVRPVLPCMLALAAGAMFYVVVEELIPESAGGVHSNRGSFGFAAGFLIMMILDVALG